MNYKNILPIIPNWPVPTNIKAFSTTRQGGISQPPYDQFNLGLHCGDDSENVYQNRRILKRALILPKEPHWLQQVHNRYVIDIHKCSAPKEDAHYTTYPKADGSYTNFSNEICVIQTADCLPILLCNEAGTEIAALHGGWRGLSAGIIEEGIRKFRSPPRKLVAWLGPAISVNEFEIGEEIRDVFIQNFPELEFDDLDNPVFKSRQKSKWFLDIYEIARRQLNHFSVENVYGGGFCTYHDKERFFSYRRDDKQTGRMATLIWMENQL